MPEIVEYSEEDEDVVSLYSYVPHDYESTYSEQSQSLKNKRVNGVKTGPGGPGGFAFSHKYNDTGFIGSDRGHKRIFQTVRGKSIPIEFFLTKYTPGTVIRNAISGIRESKRCVGKTEEWLYFKVKLLLPGMGADQYGTLFYSSPEEYERHFHTTVSQPTKEKWLSRVGDYGALYHDE